MFVHTVHTKEKLELQIFSENVRFGKNGSISHTYIPDTLSVDPIVNSYIQCTHQNIDQFSTVLVFTYNDVYLSNDISMQYPSNFQVITVISNINISYLIYHFETINFKPYTKIFPTMSLKGVHPNNYDVSYTLPWSNSSQFKAYADTGNCDITGRWVYSITQKGIDSNWKINTEGFSWTGTATGSFDVHSVVVYYKEIPIVLSLAHVKIGLIHDEARFRNLSLHYLSKLFKQFLPTSSFNITKFEVKHALIVYYDLSFVQTKPPITIRTIYKKIRSILAIDNHVCVGDVCKTTYIDPNSTYLTGKSIFIYVERGASRVTWRTII